MTDISVDWARAGSGEVRSAKRRNDPARKYLGASLMALLSAMIASPAFAQDGGTAGTTSASDNQTGLQDIVVTARKIAENLQDVPVAVTAFTGEQLERQNVRAVVDVARQTPGLAIREANGEAVAIFTMRGQVQNDSLATLDPSVGVYVDGLYWARAYGINADLVDIQNVQTLKGPQGTLFGRNTTGGAMLIQTNDPDFDGVSGLVSATYGRFNQRIGTAVVNIPLIADKLAIRGAVRGEKRDGFVTNIFNGNKDAGERNNWTGRLKLLAKPTETLSILLSGEIYGINAEQRPEQLRQLSPALGAAQIGFELGATTFPTAIAAGLAEGAKIIQFYRDNPYKSNINHPVTNNFRTKTFTGTATLDTSFGAIKFIGGYRQVRGGGPRGTEFTEQDLDGTPYEVLWGVNGTMNLRQYSGEAQITGKTADDAVDYVAGAFYFHESGLDTSNSVALPALAGPNYTHYDGEIDHDSQGLYAQASWHITDALTFTGGLRYSVEDKALTIRNSAQTPSGVNIRCIVGGTTIANNCSAFRKDDFSGVSYTAGLDYKVTPDILVYAKTSKGFRSGGQNLRATTTTNFIPFGPETAISYEGGLKSELFDRRARFNLAGHYTRVSDIQRSIFTPTTPPATLIQNAAKARILGAEAELTVLPFQGLELSATGAIVKPKYLEYQEVGPGGVIKDRRSDRFSAVPEYSASFSATYTTDVGIGKLMLHGDYSYTAKFDTAEYNEPSNPQNAAVIAATTIPAAHLVNARGSLSMMDDTLEVALWVRNLTDNNDYQTGLLVPPDASGSGGIGYAVGVRREPRTFGVTGTFRFGS
jgi:iron complex outermembrane receptor protein